MSKGKSQSSRVSKKPTRGTGREGNVNVGARLVTVQAHGESDTDSVGRFREIIWRHYRKHGRSLPWRTTKNPYHILVSEIMLQQTQVGRVIPKYERFINKFPDLSSLAEASLREILELWHGLGYNRRAIALREIAESVTRKYAGRLPSTVETLMTFPGIGRATASAISVFAFNQPTAFVETNIRRVFIHFFFQDEDDIKDSEILPLVEKTVDVDNAREWYYALMDYGAMLGKEYPNPNRRSAHYQRQSPFEGSDRQIRGLIVRTLMSNERLSERRLSKEVGGDMQRTRKLLIQLEDEGFIRKTGRSYSLA
jgi:A/G-specific adenine glycosylase